MPSYLFNTLHILQFNDLTPYEESYILHLQINTTIKHRQNIMKSISPPINYCPFNLFSCVITYCKLSSGHFQVLAILQRSRFFFQVRQDTLEKVCSCFAHMAPVDFGGAHAEYTDTAARLVLFLCLDRPMRKSESESKLGEVFTVCGL